MTETVFAFGSAVWLGLLTSVSPCPLATNVAAVSFLTKEAARPVRILSVGAAYVLGRAMAYTLLAAALTAAIVSAPLLSNALQIYGNRVLGPLLILVGMVLLDLVSLPSFGFAKPKGDAAGWRKRYRGMGGAMALGVIFALSFCPVSAALFFGSLLPLAVRSDSGVAVPFLFGVGTAAPVAAVAALLALGIRRTARILDRVSDFERWARKVTGMLFVGIGAYFCLVYLWGMGG